MAGSTVATWDELLKENYSDEELADMTCVESKTWALMKKKTNHYGRRLDVDVIYASNEGIGPTIAIAQSGLGSSLAKQFNITRKRKVGVIRLDRELLAVAKADKFAFVDRLDQELRKTDKRMIVNLCSELYRDGGGAIGRLTSTSVVATDTITLRNPDDTVRLAKGQRLQMSDTDGNSGSVRAGVITVKQVNRVTGTVTFTGNVTAGIAAAAASDYLFMEGMFGIAPPGIAAWLPAADPVLGADSFCGVDRGVDPVYLAGIRATASGGTVEDSLILAGIQGAKYGAEFDYIFMNPTLMGTLIRELGSKAMYIKTDSTEGALGTSVLSLHLPTQPKPVKVVADQFCPNGTAFFLKLDTWAIVSADQAPHIQKDVTGFMAFPVADDDSVEIRLAAYWSPVCFNPGANMRVDGF